MENYRFDEEEKRIFLRMVEYFISAEEKEIAELRGPGGNKDFIKVEIKNLEIIKSLKDKVIKVMFEQA